MASLLTPFVSDVLLRERQSAQLTGHWRADGTVLLADISGFTRLSERFAELGKAGAEELTVLLNATFESLLTVARDEGGDLVKFGGDALLLFFDGGGHAERACRAAHGMRSTLKHRGPVLTGKARVVLRISMGVHSGPFLFVLAGDVQRELFVLGEHAAVVAGMEAAAGPGQILVSSDTAALLPPKWLGAPQSGGIVLRRVDGACFAPARSALELSDAELQPFVPRSVRRRLDVGEHSAEHRRTTVAFAHIGGIDACLREHGPATVAAHLDAVMRVAVEATDHFEVSLLATDVDGGGVKLILTAGVPESVEDGEGRMLGVARALIDADLGLPVRVGVNTGHVFAGEVGAPWRRVYTVMGDAVNLSARLMSKAHPGELVASRVTLEHSSTPFESTPLEPFIVKGKRHPQLASVVGPRLVGRGRNRMGGASFVGREPELATLVRALGIAMEGDGRCVEVIGEPGIGKSRLVREVLANAGDHPVMHLACEPFAGDQPYFMARMLLRSGLGVPFDATPAEAGAVLTRWLGHHTPDLVAFAPLLAVVIDADVPSTPQVDDLGAAFRGPRLREVAAEVLRVAFAAPLLLIVEDAMWMDEASASLLAAALMDVDRTSWFGCLTTRDPAQGMGSRLGFAAETIELQPLDAHLAEQLAAELTDTADIPHNDLVELCARAEGNPLFLLELAHARLELGSVDAIPGSVEDLIAARIDRLSPADRSLLRHAAVLGDRFEEGLFEHTLADDFPGPVSWERLGDFITVDRSEVRFAHDLVRRVAYSGLPFRRRRELHRRIGMALVPSGDPDDACVGLLAHHFDGSGDPALAWRYNLMAGQRAADSYATVEATAFYERAIHNARAMNDVAPIEIAAAYEALADVALLAGRFDLCREGLRGARRLVANEPLALARLFRKEGTLSELLGRHTAAPTWFRRGLRTLEDRPGPDTTAVAAELAQLHVEWASCSIQTQKFASGERRCRLALPYALASGNKGAEAHAYYLLEWAMLELGDDDEAHTYGDLAQEIYEELGDYCGLGRVLLNRGVDGVTSGSWIVAAEQLLDSRRAFDRAGDVIRKAHASHNLSEILIEQGRHEEAESYLRESRRIWRASGFAMGIAAATSALGRTMARSGRTEEGLALIREAGDRFVQLEHAPFTAEAGVRLAEAMVFARRWDEADICLDNLGERVADGGPATVALARRMRAVAASRRGDLQSARRQLEEVRTFADDSGIGWESALAGLEIARMPGVPDDERRSLVESSRRALTAVGVDVDRVLPPSD